MNQAFNSINTDWFKPYFWVDIAVTIFLVMAFIFGLLMFRQARQMTEVLPTPLSPWIRILVITFIIIAALATFLAIGIVISGG